MRGVARVCRRESRLGSGGGIETMLLAYTSAGALKRPGIQAMSIFVWQGNDTQPGAEDGQRAIIEFR